MTKRLLIVHHTPSPHCQEMFEAVLAGATDPEIEGVEVIRRPALTCSPVDSWRPTDICSAPPPTSDRSAMPSSIIWADTPLLRQGPRPRIVPLWPGTL